MMILLTSISSTRSRTASRRSWKSSSPTTSFMTFNNKRESGRTLEENAYQQLKCIH